MLHLRYEYRTFGIDESGEARKYEKLCLRMYLFKRDDQSIPFLPGIRSIVAYEKLLEVFLLFYVLYLQKVPK